VIKGKREVKATVLKNISMLRGVEKSEKGF